MNTENKIAEQLHQQTIDLQAVIIANQQQEIDRLNILAIDNAEEKAKLKETIEWYQGRTGQRMGEATRAALPIGAVARDLMPKRTAFIAWCERRGLETVEDQDAWGKRKFKHSHIEAMWEGWFNTPDGGRDEALEQAAPAAPAEQAEPSLAKLPRYAEVHKGGDKFELEHVPLGTPSALLYVADVERLFAADLAAAAPAAPLLAQPGQQGELLACFLRSAYPVDASIDARGYRWSEAYLDQARAAALAGAAPLPELTGPSEQPEIVLVPKWAGQFDSFAQWVNKAQSWLDSPEYRRAMCVDSKGRRCATGADMARARDEGAFPVYFFWECEPVAASPSPAPAQQQEPGDISKELRRYAGEGDGYAAKLMRSAANEIERLHTAKSHLILQAQIWHSEAKSQRATVIGILARLGLPENDWEAKRLIVAHIAKLTGAPVPRVGGIASKESVEPAAPGASIDTPELNGMLYQFRHALTRDVEREYAGIIAHIDSFLNMRAGASTEDKP